MATTKSAIDTKSVSTQTLVSLVRGLLGGNPNPDDPQPPGPWDPVIRRAVVALGSNDGATGLYPFDNYYYTNPPKPHWSSIFGPTPDPWTTIARRHPAIWDVIGGQLSLVALNPQPLPPMSIFAAALAGEVINEAVARQELAELFGSTIEEQGIIIVGGRVEQFVDDWCPTGKIRWPFPGPPPPWWLEELTGIDLVVMGVQFENAAARVFNEGLQQTFANAGGKFIEGGLSRIQ